MMNAVRNGKISIILPVYNTEQYLAKCIQSVLSQTYSTFELICIDDGSIDRSGKILDELSEQDNRLIVIHQKNMGESGARNVGLSIASGDYIGFLDCDDWIEPDMYQELVHALECTESDMAISRWFRDDENGSQSITNVKQVNENVFGRSQLMRYVYERDAYRGFAYMWDKLYKKELFIESDGKKILFDESLQLGGDVLVLARLVLNTQKAVYIDKAYYHYLQRGDSGCHSSNLRKRQDWLLAYEIVIDMFEKKGIEEQIIAFVKRFMAYHSSNVAKIAYEQNDRNVLEKSQKYMKQYEYEYKALNMEYPERIEQFNQILNLKVQQ